MEFKRLSVGNPVNTEIISLPPIELPSKLFKTDCNIGKTNGHSFSLRRNSERRDLQHRKTSRKSHSTVPLVHG